SFGNAVAGVSVSFVASAGTVTGGSVATGSDGIATVGGWTLGVALGQQTITATATGNSIAGNPAIFTVNAVPGPVASITKVAGDNQAAAFGAVLPIAPAVKLADQFGNAIANQTVTFAVATGGGSVSGATPVSSASGTATAGSWTLGPSVTTQTL